MSYRSNAILLRSIQCLVRSHISRQSSLVIAHTSRKSSSSTLDAQTSCHHRVYNTNVAILDRYYKVHQNSTIPVPEIYFYDLTCNNTLKALFIVMEYLDEVPIPYHPDLNDEYFETTILEQICRIVTNYINCGLLGFAGCSVHQIEESLSVTNLERTGTVTRVSILRKIITREVQLNIGIGL